MSAFEAYALFGAPVLLFLTGCLAALISWRQDAPRGTD